MHSRGLTNGEFRFALYLWYTTAIGGGVECCIVRELMLVGNYTKIVTGLISALLNVKNENFKFDQVPGGISDHFLQMDYLTRTKSFRT